MLVQTYKRSKVCLRAQLLEDVVTTSNGEWCLAEGLERHSLHISFESGATATVQVRVSNEPAPLAAEDGAKLGDDISATGFVQLTVPVRWIKVKVTAHSGGGKKLNAYLESV
jgi:hypothetical protein